MLKHQPIRGIISAKDTNYRLSPLPSSMMAETSGENSPTITVDPSRRFQTILGFGGAFTEAAADTLFKLPEDRQTEIIKAYFDEDSGHGYTFGRTHINSCDFSLGNYAYCEKAGDTELSSFNIQRDQQKLIPLIKQSMAAAGKPINILASPWSPPAWMKTNGKMNEGGKLKTEYHQTWAEYYCRYIKEYADTGIPIWGISVQNEPAAKQTWDSCLYTAEEERDFIKNYLGPAIKKADLGDLKVVIWDHNRDLVYERAKVVLDDPKAAEYVWGTGFHWYCGDHFENIQKLHDEFPHKQLIFTEGCQEGGTHLGSWDLGERYARPIINDLNRWTVAWIDWNLILNEQGGPNHVGNYCSAPIIADTRTGELHYQSSYYYLGHFSRYMRPGSVRIQSQVSTTDLEALAAVNAHGETVVTILNSKNKTVNFNLTQANISHSVTSPPRSIITLITAP